MLFSQYADMGCEKEFGCPSCSANSAMGFSPGTVPMVDTIVKLELSNIKSPLFPQFIAHIGDIRWGSLVCVHSTSTHTHSCSC